MDLFKRTLNMFSESDSSLSHRGYTVFFEANPLQTIFGMGVKNVYKFEGQCIVNNVIHAECIFSAMIHDIPSTSK